MTPAHNRPGRRAVLSWTAALVFLCAGSLWLHFEHIAGTMPYPHHVDEGFVAGPAARIVVTGTFHPYNFNYPSLPKYLAAAGMAVGFLRSASNREIREVDRIGNVGYPYYDAPRVVETARQVFAVLAVVALAITGYAAYVARPSPAAIFLAPLALAATPLYFSDSWRYLNVDIIGACFAIFTLAAALYGTRHSSMLWLAVIPGILAGCTAGSKYTLALVIVPVLLGVALFAGERRRISFALAALASMAAAFIAVVPHSILDLPGFLNGLASEAYHYSGGHAGYEAEPGLPQLAYYVGNFADEFGLGGFALALIGTALFAIADWRRTLILLSFPAALLWLLSLQTVHFARNALALHPIVAIFVAGGAVAVYGWAAAAAERWTWRRRRLAQVAAAAIAALIAVVAVPLAHVVDQFHDRTDSRRVALEWLQEQMPDEWTVVVPRQLGIDIERVERVRSRVLEIDFQATFASGDLHEQLAKVPRPAVVLSPRWEADPRFPNRQMAGPLNDVSRHWRVVRTFGANPVLVNYSYPVPNGDPAFDVAVLDR